MAGPIRIAILANAIQARKEMKATARDAKKMSKDVEKSSKGFSILEKAGGKLGSQVKDVTGVLLGAGLAVAQVASAGVTAAPALAAVGTAAFQVGRASLQAAPALLAIAAAGIFVKLTMTQLAPALIKSVTPITTAFKQAGAAAGELAAKGVQPLARAFAKVGIPIVSAAMDRIAVSTNKVVKGFLGWAKSAPGLTALRNITGDTATAFEKVAPAVQRLAISLASMIGRISGVSLAAGSKGLTGVLDFLSTKLDGITSASVSSGLDKLRSTFDSIRNAVSQVRDVVGVAIRIFRQYRTEILILADVFAVLAIVFGGPVSAILAAVGLIVRHLDTVKAAVAQVKAVFSQPGGTEFLDKIRTVVSTLWPVVRDAFLQIKAAVLPVLSEIFTKIKTEFIPAFGDFLVAVAPVVAFFIQQFVPVIRNAFKTVGGIISGAITVISGIFQVFTGLLTGDWRKAWEGIKSIVRGAFKIVISLFTGGIGSVRNVLSTGLAAIRALWNGALNFIKSIASSAWSTLKSGVSSLVSSVKGKFSDMRSAISDRVSSAVARVKSAATSIRNAFSGVNLFSAGAKIVQSLIDGISSRAGAVIDKISSIAGSIRDHFPFSPAKRGPLKKKPMKKAGRNIVRDLAAGMAQERKVRSTAARLATAVHREVADVTGRGGAQRYAGPGITVNIRGFVGDESAVGRALEDALNHYRKINGRTVLA